MSLNAKSAYALTKHYEAAGKRYREEFLAKTRGKTNPGILLMHARQFARELEALDNEYKTEIGFLMEAAN